MLFVHINMTTSKTKQNLKKCNNTERTLLPDCPPPHLTVSTAGGGGRCGYSVKVVLREASQPPVTVAMVMAVEVARVVVVVQWFRVVHHSHGNAEGCGWRLCCWCGRTTDVGRWNKRRGTGVLVLARVKMVVAGTIQSDSRVT